MGQLSRWVSNTGLLVATLACAIVLEAVLLSPDEHGLAWFGAALGSLILYFAYTVPTFVVYVILVSKIAQRTSRVQGRIAAILFAPLSYLYLLFAEGGTSTDERLVTVLPACILLGALLRLPDRGSKFEASRGAATET